MVVSRQVLRTTPNSTARAASALNYWVFSPAPISHSSSALILPYFVISETQTLTFPCSSYLNILDESSNPLFLFFFFYHLLLWEASVASIYCTKKTMTFIPLTVDRIPQAQIPKTRVVKRETEKILSYKSKKEIEMNYFSKNKFIMYHLAN